MTEPRDPVEAWLSADVDLLPPSAGAFERIHRRARRRRAVRAAGAACGAAAIVAAAVIAPQVIGNLLPQGGGPQKFTNGTTLPAPSHRPTSPSPHSTGGRSQGRGPALATAGTGQAPAPGFAPSSVTFINGGSLGAVIGQARCPAGPCTAVAGSSDYGQHWTRLGAPPAGPPDGAAGVSQIRFGDTMDGWAYGPALYATHDGGVTWQPVTLPGRVIDLSVVAGRTFAVVASCSGTGPSYATGCSSFALYQASATSNAWRPVPGAAGRGAAAPGGLQLAAGGGYLLAGRQLFAGPVTGGAWHRVSSGAAGVPACLRTPAAVPGPALIAPAGSLLYLACDAAPAHGAPGQGRLTLYDSADGGRTWQRAGPIPAPGTPTSLAAIPGGAIVLATSSGIEYSPDGSHWLSAKVRTPAGGFSFVGMTTTSDGVAVPAGSAASGLFITRDGGATWTAARIVR